MKKTTTALLLCIATPLTSVASCAHDVDAHYPNTFNQQSGKIEVALTHAARHINVTVDDNLVVHDAHSKRIVIDNVPAGLHRVAIAMGGDGADPSEHEATLNVQANSTASLVAAAPELSISNAIVNGSVFIGEMIALAAVVLVAHR
jgi:hypothetical protein